MDVSDYGWHPYKMIPDERACEKDQWKIMLCDNIIIGDFSLVLACSRILSIGIARRNLLFDSILSEKWRNQRTKEAIWFALILFT